MGLRERLSPPEVLAPPAWPGDFPDPFVLVVPGGYAAFATNSAGVNVQVRTSADLEHWQAGTDALPHLPAWAAAGRTWSPAVLERGGTFVLWYSVHEPGWGRQAVSMAVADAPTGPYRDESAGPAVFQVEEGGSIDPSPFVDAGGDAYLLWKADANAVGRRSSLWVQRLSDDGRRLDGEPNRILDRDRRWERPLIEAPSLVRAAGRYWLLYSAGMFNSAGYAMGLAVGDGPCGPFQKLSVHRRWVGSDRSGAGPGGQEPFTDHRGELRLAYHAWQPGSVGYRSGGERSLRIGHLDAGAGDLVLRP